MKIALLGTGLIGTFCTLLLHVLRSRDEVVVVYSREAHPGPHCDWFRNLELSGGGAIIDLGCHCIEIGRSFIGKDIRLMEGKK